VVETLLRTCVPLRARSGRTFGRDMWTPFTRTPGALLQQVVDRLRCQRRCRPVNLQVCMCACACVYVRVNMCMCVCACVHTCVTAIV
jgi:hypothetical protein